MESNGSFNGAIRIKEEPIEVSLTENNDYETIDKEPNSNNVQSSRFRDNSAIRGGSAAASVQPRHTIGIRRRERRVSRAMRECDNLRIYDGEFFKEKKSSCSRIRRCWCYCNL
uniref:Uncharacterized protein n=1 Tax=Trichogramma kaykai TaxID=54128 RepID=A0ABD2XQ07_9HYME